MTEAIATNMSFDEIISEYEKMQKALKEKGIAMLNESFKKIFELYPEISVVKWSQYTPWFNDGDECVFSVHDFVVSNAPDAENVSAWEDYEGDEEFGIDGKPVWVESLYGNTASRYPELKKIDQFSGSTVGKAVFKDIFDDHAIVTVTRGGIVTEEYEHD